MTAFRYRKSGVKVEHQIIPGWAPLLEKLAQEEGIRLVIPGRIHQARHAQPLGVRLTYPTRNGWKLRIYSGPLVQEVFVVGRRGAIEDALAALGLNEVKGMERRAT